MAGTKEVPINPAVLDWAMQESGTAAEDIAKACKVDTNVVVEWLDGTRRPSVGQYRRLASHLRRPTSFFFLPEPPQSPVTPELRKSLRRGKSPDLHRDEAKAIRLARRAQNVARSVRLSLDEIPLPLPQFDLATADPEASAAVVRRFLEWSITDQLSAGSKSAVTSSLRSRIETLGVLVMQFSMGAHGHRGFSFADPIAPVIAVNTHYNTQARSFTYAHELGHLCLGSGAVCEVNQPERVETWCDEFAAALLLPRADFIRIVRDSYGFVTDFAVVKKVANKFHMSQAATALRLWQLGLSDENYYNSINFALDFGKSGGGGAGGTPTAEKRVNELGRPFTDLLVHAEDARVLRRHDVLGYLDVTSTQLAEVRELLRSTSESDR